MVYEVSDLIWRFPKMGIPNGWAYNGKSENRIDNLGVPQFLEISVCDDFPTLLFCTSGSDTVAFGRIVIVDSRRPG